MTNVYLSSNSSAGTNITLAAGQDAFIGANVNRASQNDYGISALFSGHAIEVQGHVFGDDGGIVLGAVATFVGSRINVGLNGSVTGRVIGIETLGNTISISNAGQISANDALVHSGGAYYVSNSGNITGTYGHGIDADATSGEIVNTGTITSSYIGYGIVFFCNELGKGLAGIFVVMGYGDVQVIFDGLELAGPVSPHRGAVVANRIVTRRC